MNCPKCGLAQEQGGEECIGCGIIFQRWRESQEQAILRRQTGSYASPAAEEGRTIPRWLAGFLAIGFVLLGILWTSYYRSAKAKRNLAEEGKALVNDLTPAINKARKRQAEETQRLRRMEYAIARAEAGRKVDTTPRAFSLDEQGAMLLVNQCRETTIRETIQIPKDIQDLERNSDILQLVNAAERDRLLFVERDYGRLKIKLGYAADVPGISDLNDRIDIDLGGRKVTEITRMTGRADHVEAEMYFAFENKVACRRLGIKEKPALAGFILQDGAWRVQWATIPDGGREPFRLCR